MVGRTLSHYRIVERLGAGGMGEVYRAHDEKLDRDVALKVLPEGALSDESARARFRKEAHALSRLSHPHIAHLLDFDSEDGVDFLVMELVTGPSLAEKLREGPLPETDVLRLGSQLARGLQAAHEQGVIHRDLKPSNLHLTPDGLLKILDFGLARLLRPKSTPPGHSTATETAAGAIVGSPPYMAPEQLLGKPPDPRTDLYAAGAVLYEMVTARRPFGTRSGVALTDAILHEPPPPPSSLSGSVSAALESVILKALDKDPDLRYQTARELLVDLERLRESEPAASRRGRAGPRGVGVATVALALVVVLVGVVALRPSPRITGVRVLAPDLKTTGFFGFLNGSWACDGQNVYYVAGTGDSDLLGIFRVPIEGGDPVRVALPSRHYVSLTIHAYVPGEKALLVTSGEDQRDDMPDGLPLLLVPVPFGAPRRIPNLLAWGAELSPDGRTLALTDIVGSGPELRWRLVLAGLDGSWQRVVGPLPPRVGRVRWTPDGRRLRFSSRDLEKVGWESQIWEMPLEGGQPRPVGPGMGGRWTNDGKYFLFERQGGGALQYDIHARDESRWLPHLAGATQRLTVGPVSFRQTGPSPDGRQLFAYGHMGRGELRRLDPVTRTWRSALGGESAIYAEPSPDGQWLAWVRYPDGTLWKSRTDGSDRLRLTSPPLEAHQPRWSPDGQRLVFVGRSPEQPQLSVHVVATDGSRSDVVARPPGSDDYWDPCWMPDGRVVISRLGRKGGLLEAGGGAPHLIPGTEDLTWHKCSRRGDLLAVRIDRAGYRLNVRRAAAAAWEDFGPATIMYPNWTRDARAFCGYQVDPDARIVCVSLASRQRTTLADNPPFPLIGWLATAWMGLDAEDRPMVTADRSTTGFYALDWEAP